MYFLRNLNLGEMIALTTEWTGTLKPVFVSIPEIAGLLPVIADDHAALLGAASSNKAQAKLLSLMALADAYDGSHDHLIRGLDYLVEGTAEVLLGIEAADPVLAEALRTALRTVLPNGLAAINASYSAEAGNSAQMVIRADNEASVVFSKVPVIGGLTALDLVHLIGKVGANLGSTEQQKAIAAAEVAEQAIPPAEIKARMRAWASGVETVLAALDRSKAPAATIAQIREPARKAIAAARDRVLAERAAKKKKAAEDAEAEAKAEADAKAEKGKADKGPPTPVDPASG